MSSELGMKVKDIIESEKENFDTFEVWQYTDRTHRLHTDFIKNVDEIYSMSILKNIPVYNYEIMDEDEYSSTILINSDSPADFEEWYDNKDTKVLVIMLDWTIDIEDEKYKSQEKYDKENTKRFSIKLNKNTDSEIIDWLNKQDNKQGAIKAALKQAVENSK